MDKQKIIQAFVALDNNPDFEVVVDWMRERLRSQEEENTQQFDETRLRWGQGRAQQLSALLGEFDSSRENMVRIKEAKKDAHRRNTNGSNTRRRGLLA